MLAVEQMVVIGTDPDHARGIARGPIEFLNANPAYPASYRRMGFTGREIAGLSDRLVDALVPWGAPDAVAAAISSQLRAGADHVAVSLRDDPSQPYDRTKWRELAVTPGQPGSDRALADQMARACARSVADDAPLGAAVELAAQARHAPARLTRRVSIA